MTKQLDSKAWTILFLSWLVAIIATGGSLFFSEVMEFVPCSLCWYQRIFMYPLAVVLSIGLLTSDKSVFWYSMPFVGGGLFFAIYHNLLHAGIIPETMSPCVSGVPCTARWIEWFGFITIPVLSLVAFTIIGSLLIYFYRNYSK